VSKRKQQKRRSRSVAQSGNKNMWRPLLSPSLSLSHSPLSLLHPLSYCLSHIPKCVCVKSAERKFHACFCISFFFVVLWTNIKANEGVRRKERERKKRGAKRARERAPSIEKIFYVWGKNQDGGQQDFGNLSKWKTCFFLGVSQISISFLLHFSRVPCLLITSFSFLLPLPDNLQ